MAGGRSRDGEPDGLMDGQTRALNQSRWPSHRHSLTRGALDTAAVASDYFWPLEEALGDFNDHIRQQ